MLNRESLINVLKDIHREIPQIIIDELMLTRVTEENLDEFLSRYLIAFPPNYLPILEYDGDLYGIHLSPGLHWRDCPWVQLPHDELDIQLVTTSFKYLPYAFFSSRLNRGKFVEEIIDSVTYMLDDDLAKPDMEYIISNMKRKKHKITAKYNTEDGANFLAANTHLMDDDEVIDIAEEIFPLYPEDTICLVGSSYLRNKFNYGDAITPAVKVIHKEVFVKNRNYWIERVDSAPEILEEVRKIALTGLPSKSPFQKMNNTSYTSKEAVPVLKEIARDFHKLGEEQLALNQLRNAAMIEGIYNGGITKELCLELAEQCDRVKKDSLAGALARYAAEVIYLGA